MKNILEYVSTNWQQKLIVLLVGLLLGWLIFGGKTESNHSHEKHQHANETSADEATIWTCSMHPQIQQPNEGDCPICGMDLIPMDNSSGSSSPAIIEMNADAIKLANVQTTTVEKGQSEKEILLNGKVSIDERRISSQAIHFDGRIEKLFVNFEGEKVNKGQTLATVYAPKLISAQEELLQALKTKDNYPELAKAAEQKLKFWKINQNQIEEIKSSGKIQEYFEIKADASGYVIKRNVAEGAYAKAGSILFEIADLRKVWIVFDAYEKDLSFIHKGDDIEFTVSAFPSKLFNSKITYIDPLIDTKKRILKVRTEANNKDNFLKSEMFVNGIIYAKLNHSKHDLIIPKSAIMWTGKRSIAYVKVDGGFEMREVELGESLGESYTIKEGIEEGEEVVSKGTFTVDAAAQLNNKYSMMNRPGSEPGAPKLQQYVSDSFSAKLRALLTSYLSLKDIMVETKAKESNLAAKSTMKALMQMKPSEVDLKGKALKFWKEKFELLHNHLADITKTSDMEQQRKAFKPFNEELIASMKSLGTGENKVYIQYCPMADNDTGAYWLSLEEKIMNPYFGDVMLHCGEVTDTLTKEEPKTINHEHQH
ncbi:MAG: efflux RND transporter periplasmic adaptor subunit [Marinifilum sp.]|jgi:Cu(I)/Ag(I) efflux system membrane fusion protein|nr:efflux RND transporter periplasmic adaptor subunit [Marinifilum sp.]